MRCNGRKNKFAVEKTNNDNAFLNNLCRIK